ncbi:MAG: PaaI family thioesterase, partial [Acetobacteraceae bacterium]|nr:PaaI family thioesterase [Acetobacteraceae bacterium]
MNTLAEAGWTEHRVPGFSVHVGPFLTREIDGERRFAFRAEEHHLNGNGVVHGGMLMTFLDQAIGTTVWNAIGRVPCA